MPIGKNAIKRVSNNGYSKVASSAPDMENSTVVKAPKEEKKKTAAPVSNKTVAKKAEVAKKSSAKAEKTVKNTKKTAEKTPINNTKTKVKPGTVSKNVVKNDTRTLDNGCVNIGGEMPIYLL